MAGLRFPKPTPRVRLRKAYLRERDVDERNAKAEVWARANGRCEFCFCRVERAGLDSLDRGEVHHITPRSRLAKTKHWDTRHLVLLCVAHHRDAQAYRLLISGNANRVLKFEAA